MIKNDFNCEIYKIWRKKLLSIEEIIYSKLLSLFRKVARISQIKIKIFFKYYINMLIKVFIHNKLIRIKKYYYIKKIKIKQYC